MAFAARLTCIGGMEAPLGREGLEGDSGEDGLQGGEGLQAPHGTPIAAHPRQLHPCTPLFSCRPDWQSTQAAKLLVHRFATNWGSVKEGSFPREWNIDGGKARAEGGWGKGGTLGQGWPRLEE